MVKHIIATARTKARKAIRRKSKPEINAREEKILQAATLELITKHGGLFVATDLRKTKIKGFQVWIITVTMRYPTGHEGYVGDLLYDGKHFTMLTESSVIHERVLELANDPERLRKWNEYRAATLQTGKG